LTFRLKTIPILDKQTVCVCATSWQRKSLWQSTMLLVHLDKCDELIKKLVKFAFVFFPFATGF
jgi:hypothetical protein